MNNIPKILIGANSRMIRWIMSGSNSGTGTIPDTPTCSVSQARLFPPLSPTSSSSSSNSAALTTLLVLPAMRTMPQSSLPGSEQLEILAMAAGDTVTSMLDSILCFSSLCLLQLSSDSPT